MALSCVYLELVLIQGSHRLPHRGQGGVTSIEDAATLGLLFKQRADSQARTLSVGQRLELFENIRQKRVSVLQVISEVPLFDDAMMLKRSELLQYLPNSELPGENLFPSMTIILTLTHVILPSKHPRPSRMDIQTRLL